MFACVALALTARSAAAGDLRYDLATDIPVTVVATGGWFISEALKDRLAAEPCRWCDRTSGGTDDVNGVDASVRQSLRWSATETANAASNVTAFVLAPIAAFGATAAAAHRDAALGNAPVDGLVIAEAVALAADLNQVVKLAVGRERPFVHALTAEEKKATKHPSDNNTSFYSGHTNLAFALAVSSGTVASMRGYRWAPWVWGAGLSLAATTGYLRIAADRHYFTDVVTGAAVGSAVGFSVPWLLHRPSGSGPTPLSVSPAGSMRAVVVTGRW